jgi:uncharacterized protein YheU (UPF0270 family)
LTGVVEEYVTRDGTELTDATGKVASVLAALDRGELVLVYDSEADSCNIMPADQLPDDRPAGE